MQQALPMEATLLHFLSVLVFALSYCSFLSMGTVNLCFSHIPFSYSTLPLVQDLSAGRRALYIYNPGSANRWFVCIMLSSL